MSDPQFDKMTVAELKDLLPRIDKAIAERETGERSALRNRLREMAEAAGYSLAEIVGGGRGRKDKGRAAKFANPDDRSETWSGRGRMPNWLRARLKAGETLDQFRID